MEYPTYICNVRNELNLLTIKNICVMKNEISKKDEKALLNALKVELTSLAGACRSLKKLASIELFTAAGVAKETAIKVMFHVDNSDLVKIAANCAEKVGTTFAREVVIVQKHAADKSKCFDRSAAIKPLAGITYKDFGFTKPIKRDDCATLGYIRNVSQGKTIYKEFVYVERTTFSPIYVLKCIVAYVNAGAPALRETKQNKERRAKVAAAKKEQKTA